jgi:hypothetical protein
VAVTAFSLILGMSLYELSRHQQLLESKAPLSPC